MRSLRRMPLATGTLVCVLLAGAFCVGAPLIADNAQSSSEKAGTTQQKPASGKPAVQGQVVELRATRRGRLMPGGDSQDNRKTPGIFDGQTDLLQPITRQHPREQRMQRAGTFDGDLRAL